MSNEIIFHHYPTSPFSEKIRLIFGIKKLVWRSVEIPNMMPKPDLVPLTGGYRKTPVMQIGADIICDTQLIARELERRFPAPPIDPTARHGPAIRTWLLGRSHRLHADCGDHLRRDRRCGTGSVQERPGRH